MVQEEGMFFVEGQQEAEELAKALMKTLAFVTIRELVEPRANGFKYAVYWKDAYNK